MFFFLSQGTKCIIICIKIMKMTNIYNNVRIIFLYHVNNERCCLMRKSKQETQSSCYATNSNTNKQSNNVVIT